MTAGAYSAGGVLYNYRSAVRNAINNMAEGTRTYAFTMSDIAVPVHTQTQTGFPVVIDNTAPRPVNWTATNRAGGIVGRAEPGDIVTYTWTEPIDPSSLIPGWNGGSPVTVAARISFNGGGNGRFRIRNAAGTATLPFGTVFLGQNYVTASANFMNSSITMLGNTATVVLGTPAAATTVTVTTPSTARWTSNAGAYDAAANACCRDHGHRPRLAQGLVLKGVIGDRDLRPIPVRGYQPQRGNGPKTGMRTLWQRSRSVGSPPPR